MPPIAITSEFQGEIRRRRHDLLRRRFSWYAGVCIGLQLLSIASSVVTLLVDPSTFVPATEGPVSAREVAMQAQAEHARHMVPLGIVSDTLILTVIVVVLLRVLRGQVPSARLPRLSMGLVTGTGLMELIVAALMFAGDAPDVERQGILIVILAAVQTAIMTFKHSVACLILPLTPREALRPMAPLCVVQAVLTLLFALSTSGRGLWPALAAVAVFPLFAAPGLVVTWWRSRRQRDVFLLDALRGRYASLQRELTDARRIHESLFPVPNTRGALRFDYRYEPMSQIGGDYVYARFGGVPREQPAREHPGATDDHLPPLSLLLIDVTGHGVTAALIVQRLYGEVERQFAERPDIAPDQLITALNRYVYLTLAPHDVYATALCCRVDPREGRLLFASAGHPPALLRGVDGTLRELPSTAIMLGAVGDREFAANAQSLPFGPGDALLAYTDGAMEAISPEGRMLGTQGILRVVASAGRGGPGDLATALLAAVEAHRDGPPRDDTLVVELSHLIADPPAATPRDVRVENGEGLGPVPALAAARL